MHHAPVSHDTDVPVSKGKPGDGQISAGSSAQEQIISNPQQTIQPHPKKRIVLTAIYLFLSLAGAAASIISTDMTNQLSLFHVFMKCMVFLLLLWVTFLLFAAKVKMEVVYTAIVLLLGMVYMVIMTPLSPPDEYHHYASAYKVSNLLMAKWDVVDYGAAADFNIGPFSMHHNSADGYLYVGDTIFNARPANQEEMIPPPNDISYPLQYVPAALGVTVARILNLNFVWLFYLGRLCNMLFYTALIGVALWRAPRFKLSIFLIAILPMAIHQAASYSYDAFVNGLSLLLMSFMIAAIYEKGTLREKDYVAILLCTVLLAPSKVIYFLLSFLVLLIPAKRFQSKKHRIIQLSCILFSGILMILVFNIGEISDAAAAIPKPNWEGGYNYSLSDILQSPLDTLGILGRTLLANGMSYVSTCIGRYLSGLSLPIPLWVVCSFAALLVLSMLYSPMKENGLLADGTGFRMPLWHRLSYCLIAVATILAAMLYMLIDWTSSFRTIIVGVQGRYFIPILLVAILPLCNNVISARWNLDKWFVIGCVSLQFIIIERVLSYTISTL